MANGWTKLRLGLRGISAVVLTLAAVGCPPNAPPEAAPQRAEPRLVTNNPLHPTPQPRDAPDPVQVVIHLEVWDLVVPYGTVSENDAFWKRINEQAVDVATFDLLWRNGVRVGVSPAGEWPYFKQIIEQNPAQADKQTHIARTAKQIELQVRGETLLQDLFVFDDSNRMSGRSFDRSVNLWSLSFQPTPREVGSVRVALCPVVRSVRRHLEFIGDREGRTITYVSPERLYDLNLIADIPMDSFMVIAPSPEARHHTSIGHNFLTVDHPAEQMERVLLLVPKPYAISPD